MIREDTRTKITGEVFTPMALVDKVVDALDIATTINPNILDPACGNGQFIINVLNRKATSQDWDNALKNVYGVDIMASNIADLIARIVFLRIFKLSIFNDDSSVAEGLESAGYDVHDDFYWLKEYVAAGNRYSRTYKYKYKDVGVTIRNHATQWWRMEYYIHGGYHTTYTGGGFCSNFVVADGLLYDYEFDGKVPACESDEAMRKRIKEEDKVNHKEMVDNFLEF